MKSRIIEQIEDGRLDSSDLENLFQDIKDNFNEEEQTELYNLFISELKEINGVKSVHQILGE